MNRFYLILGVRWIISFIFIGVTVSTVFATLMSIGTYAYKGFAPLDAQTWSALQTIWLFWLGIGYGIGMIAALVLALGTLLYRCIEGQRLLLLNCKEERIESLELKPYFKLWRKWFFTIIWINAAQAVILIVIHKLLFGGAVWISWFNPWIVTPMIIFSGLLALPIMIRRSKRVRIEPCVL